jgi:hypothetical protein
MYNFFINTICFKFNMVTQPVTSNMAENIMALKEDYPKNGSLLVFVDNFSNFLHVFICVTCGGEPERSQSSTEVSPCLNLENHSKVCVLPMALSPKDVSI